MTAPLSSIGVQPSASGHASPPSAAPGDGPERFAALVGGARARASETEGEDVTAREPSGRVSGGATDAAQAGLQADIATLAAGAQAAFKTASGPEARAAVLQEFGAALEQLLSDFGASAGDGVLQAEAVALVGPVLQTMALDGAEPLTAAEAVLGLLGLDTQAAVTAAATGGVAGLIAGVRPPATAATGGPSSPAQSPAGPAAPAMPEGHQAAQPNDPRVLEAAGEGAEVLSPGVKAGASSPAAGEGGAAGVLAPARTSDAAANATFQPPPGATSAEAAPGSRGASDARAPLFADPSHAQASGAAAQAGPAFSRHLLAQVRGAHITEGGTRIELTPRGLGDIEIDMRHDEAGKLRIVLKAENPAVLAAFRNDRDMLIGALRDGGVAVDDAELSFESFGGHQSRENPDRDDWRPAMLWEAALPAEAGASPWIAEARRPAAPGRAGLDIIT
ncbi:flagellar hook-length control protein FliK [Roseibacterium sp. SDUM158017]|uniref:flagellar hook-length control protein FliK n=1 Tax=Roseicyclus salinarum TaxID=3036773 RepID=UPI002414DAC8|nr:flagellar hook-length control protein FliK [Roseibacterium sp. SDUM158017]MDG4648657.1 flagellar hook-length control protein FliK [Roseibacterium sp. SDUM158017]